MKQLSKIFSYIFYSLTFGITLLLVQQSAFADVSPPGLTEHSGEIIAAVRGTDKKIRVRRLSGDSWTGHQSLGDTTTRKIPRPFVFDGRLRMVFQSRDSADHIHYKSETANGWAQSERLNSTTSKTPFGLEHGGKLYILFRAKNGSKIKIKRLNGSTWENAKEIGSTTSEAPTAVSLGSLMLIAFRSGDSSGNVFLKDGTPDSWNPANKMNFKTDSAPMLVGGSSDVVLLYKPKDGGESVSARLKSDRWDKEYSLWVEKNGRRSRMKSINGPTGVWSGGKLYVGTNPSPECYEIAKEANWEGDRVIFAQSLSHCEGEPDGGNAPLPITECGIGVCPSGMHPSEFLFDDDCEGNGPNATKCAPNIGPQFVMCGNVCPDGYEASGSRFSEECSLSPGPLANNAELCKESK